MPHDMCDVMTLLVTDDWGTVHMQTAHIWLGWSHACALCKQPGIGSLATCEGHGGRRADRCGHDQCHICTHDTSYLMPYVPYTTALTEDVFTKMVLHNIAQALTVEEIFQIVRWMGTEGSLAHWIVVFCKDLSSSRTTTMVLQRRHICIPYPSCGKLHKLGKAIFQMDWKSHNSDWKSHN